MVQHRTNQKTDIYQQLLDKSEECFGNPAMGSTTLMTLPQLTDSARCVMFSSHIFQRVVLEDTELPIVFTNHENTVGDYSSFNKKAQFDYDVIHIVDKFKDIDTDEANKVKTKLYFVYNKDENCYDVLDRINVEDLTEKYGFEYDTSGIDRFKVGDTIKKGDQLIRPTSYDKYGNYGYGRNVRFMYQIDNDTIEDAIVVSESLAKSMTSIEVEQVTVPINDNDFLINLYGDSEVYKSFPDIGENTMNKRLCVKRVINNSQILFDFKNMNTKTILSSDIPTYIDGEVVDIDIWCNKSREEIPDTIFNSQILKYMDMTTRYYTEIRDITGELINSGIPCSQAIKALHKRSVELTSGEYKIKDDTNSVFSNIIMTFTVKRRSGLTKGQKLTGRYGNKGVISVIRKDYEMPRIRTGEHTSEQVDIIFNTLGVFNRLIIAVLYEQSITFITDNIVSRMKQMDINSSSDIKEFEHMVFTTIRIFNAEQADKFQEYYKANCKLKKDKQEFFKSVMEDGIRIHIKPFWHEENLYESVKQCYEEFPWIQPYETFFFDKISKRWVKQINRQIVGKMYVMVLKQNSKKGLSVCATAPINKRGVPDKTDSAKKHKSIVQHTPVRSGIQETINNIVSVPSEDLAQLHMLYRSSSVGRRKLGATIINNYGKNEPIEIDMNEKMTNSNVEILGAFLKIMGLELIHENDELYLPDNSDDDNELKVHKFNGNTYISTPIEMRREVAKDLARRSIEAGDYIEIGEDSMSVEQFVDELADMIEQDITENPERYVYQRYREEF